jgi:hypothetical protein
MSTITQSTDLAERIRELESELRSAEQARVRPEDRHAQQVRDQLQAKREELHAQQAAEHAASTKLLHQQAILSLAEIDRDIHAEKTKLDDLRTQYSALASEIQRTEFRHGSMLRAYVKVKQQLGV